MGLDRKKLFEELAEVLGSWRNNAIAYFYNNFKNVFCLIRYLEAFLIKYLI